MEKDNVGFNEVDESDKKLENEDDIDDDEEIEWNEDSFFKEEMLPSQKLCKSVEKESSKVKGHFCAMEVLLETLKNQYSIVETMVNIIRSDIEKEETMYTNMDEQFGITFPFEKKDNEETISELEEYQNIALATSNDDKIIYEEFKEYKEKIEKLMDEIQKTPETEMEHHSERFFTEMEKLKTDEELEEKMRNGIQFYQKLGWRLVRFSEEINPCLPEVLTDIFYEFCVEDIEKFRLFDLPDNARNLVLRILDPLEIINLSHCSKASESEVKTSEFTDISSMDVVFQQSPLNNEGTEFAIFLKSGKNYLKIAVISRQHKLVSILENNQDVIFNRQIIFGKFYHVVEAFDSTFIIADENILPLSVCISSSLLNLYDTKLKSIEIDLKVTNSQKLRSLLEWKQLGNVEHLVLKNEKLEEEDLNFVLKNLEKLDKLILKCDLDENMDLRDNVKIEILHLDDAKWITSDKLARFQCSEIVLNTHNLSFSDINAFIKNWLNGKDTKFNELTINNFDGTIQDRNCIMDGFPTKEWDSKRRGPMFLTSDQQQIYCQNGVDIERDDGLLATICFMQTSFSFVVWHEPFPTLESLNT